MTTNESKLKLAATLIPIQKRFEVTFLWFISFFYSDTAFFMSLDITSFVKAIFTSIPSKIYIIPLFSLIKLILH